MDRLSIRGRRAIETARTLALGGLRRRGLLPAAVIYILLAGIGYVYLYPVLFMVANSLKDLEDLLNPIVRWIPTRVYWGNYTRANHVMSFLPVLLETVYVVALPSAVQTLAAALVGYGFARFRFPLKALWFPLMLATFIIPPQVTMIPEFLVYKRLGLLGSVLSFVIPAALGQGLRSALFILIFYQFTRMLPRSMEEAALVDGAGGLMVFLRVVVPISGPAFLVSFLFSFVWYWNETYLANLYFGDVLTTLPLQLLRFVASYERIYPVGAQPRDRINEAIKMAGTVLTIAPVVLIYFVLQKWFVEGVDRTGVTGE